MIKITSDITKALLKEYKVDSTTASTISGGTIVTLKSDGTVETLDAGASYATTANYCVLTDTSYSKDAISQVTVIYGGTVEIDTDNVTFTSPSPGDRIYVGANGKLTATASSNTAIGWIEKVGSTDLTLKLVLS
jgi:hypothetical protein